MTFKAFPDPGRLPTTAAPEPGKRFTLDLPDLPPRKERRRSCRNPKHPHYDRFLRLREAATEAMAGRHWFAGGVGLELVVFGSERLHWELLNGYMGGIMDTLGGGHGNHFTYLPIVYQDDGQVVSISSTSHVASEQHYTLDVSFLPRTAYEHGTVAHFQ